MTEHYGLGRLPAPDARDGEYRMASVLMRFAPLPRYRYWRVGPILDQGSTSSCVGQAWRQWLTSGPVRTLDGPDAITLYHTAQTVDEWDGESYDGTSVRAGAKVLQTAGHVSTYVWSWDAQTIGEFVRGVGPVVVGTAWYESMFTPDERGYIDIAGSVAGGHAWLITGYSQTRGVFRAVNSWGRGWGESGRFWVTGEQLNRLLAENGESCSALERDG